MAEGESVKNGFVTKTEQTSKVVFQNQARSLLRGKYILIIGDSVQRGVYKDLVAFLEDGCLLTHAEKVGKMEQSFRGDRLMACTTATNGTNFTEVREYNGIMEKTMNGTAWKQTILIRYIFTTRVFNDYLKNAISALTKDFFPDVVYFQSTFWDITRYGDGIDLEDGVRTFPEFEQKLREMMEYVDFLAKEHEKIGCIELPCLKIFRSALPIGRHARGGLLVEEIKFGLNSESFRVDLGHANVLVKNVVQHTDWDYMDTHYLYKQLQSKDKFREKDGVHWNQLAHRWLTYTFITWLANSWKVTIKAPGAPRGYNHKDPKTELEEIFQSAQNFS